MKKLMLIAALAAASVGIVGCEPSDAMINTAMNLAGQTAGFFIRNSNMADQDKENVVKMVVNVKDKIPTGDQTITSLWSDFLEAEVDKLVQEEKIESKNVPYFDIAIQAVCEGLDFTIAKYPKIKESSEKLSAAIDSFIKGLQSGLLTSASKNVEVDKELYSHLKASCVRGMKK